MANGTSVWPGQAELVDNPDGSQTMRISNLRLRLMAQDLPAYQVAALCHIHPSTFSAYTRGVKAIKSKHLANICDVLNCSPHQVLGWTEFTV